MLEKLAQSGKNDVVLIADEVEGEASGGGLEQQRHPGIAEEIPPEKEEPKQLDLIGVEQDDSDGAAERKAMDRAQGPSPQGLSDVARGHGINETSGRDLLPGL